MNVTVAQLEKWDACSEQVATFHKEWGDWVMLTRAVLLRAAELRLDLEWWLGRAKPAIYAGYWAALKPIDAEYEAARKPIDAEYWAARKPIYAEYRAARKPILAEYEAARKPILAEYEAARKSILAEYEAARANLIADLLGLEVAE